MERRGLKSWSEELFSVGVPILLGTWCHVRPLQQRCPMLLCRSSSFCYVSLLMSQTGDFFGCQAHAFR